jgi:peptidylglycine monooxygenase
MDIWVDPAGLVYVTDQVPSLHLLSSTGERLGRARPSLNGAHGICGAPDGTLYLSEMRPHTLTRLRPLD